VSDAILLIDARHQNRDNASLGYNSSSSGARVARNNLDDADNALYVKLARSGKRPSKEYPCRRCGSHAHWENDCTRSSRSKGKKAATTTTTRTRPTTTNNPATPSPRPRSQPWPLSTTLQPTTPTTMTLLSTCCSLRLVTVGSLVTVGALVRAHHPSPRRDELRRRGGSVEMYAVYPSRDCLLLAVLETFSHRRLHSLLSLMLSRCRSNRWHRLGLLHGASISTREIMATAGRLAGAW
jgi:hypothetical protein